jgi:putative phosphoesterase
MMLSLPMEIAIISDTHMPRGGRRLPAECIERLRAADLIVHAGDLMTLAVLDELSGYGEVVAVHGNVDDGEVRALLPETATVTADGVSLGVVHDAGPAAGRLERLRRRFPNADGVVFGHSHMPLSQRSPDGFQMFNPGSPTERRRAPAHTMGLAQLSAGRLRFGLIRLG